MRAKLDENLPVEAAELLRTAGWECDTVYDEGLAGADDPIVAARCQVEARVARHHEVFVENPLGRLVACRTHSRTSRIYSRSRTSAGSVRPADRIADIVVIDAIGESHSRFRKPTPIARAVERLMLLDAVLRDLGRDLARDRT